jgi:threonine dehydratase
VDEVVRVDTDAICAAIKDVFEDTRTVLEPAGALAVAGAKAYVERTGIRRRTLAAVASGANMNFDRLRFVAEEAELGERARRSSRSRSRSGPAASGILLARRRAQHHRVQLPLCRSPHAHVFVGVQVHDRKETARIVRALRGGPQDASISRTTSSPSCTSATVGGHAPVTTRSLPLRVSRAARGAHEVPDRHEQRWNISLFHYRNHGADYGRVLVGMQVPPRDKRKFRSFLARVVTPAAKSPATPPTACSSRKHPSPLRRSTTPGSVR